MSITQDEHKTIWIGTATFMYMLLNKATLNFCTIQVLILGFTFIPGLLPLRNGNLLVAAFLSTDEADQS